VRLAALFMASIFVMPAACGKTLLETNSPRTSCRRSDLAAVSPCTSRSHDVLTAIEIRASGFNAKNALEVIEELRPEFLHATATVGASAADRPDLRINDSPADLGALREIPTDAIAEVRLVRAVDTVMLYGARYRAGLLMVWLK